MYVGQAFGQHHVKLSPTIAPPTSAYILSPSEISCYEDATHQLTFEEIRSHTAKFTAPSQLNIGLSSSTHWIKLELASASVKAKYLLELACRLDYFTVFQEVNGQWQTQKMGFRELDFEQRAIQYHHFIIPITWQSDKPQTIYLKLKSHEALKLYMTLYTEKHFLNTAAKTEGFYGLFYGMGVIMILYNLFLFIGLRDKNYFNYIVVIFLSLLVISIIDGHYIYVLPDIAFWFQYSNQIIIIFISSGVWFALHFLEVRLHHSLYYRICLGLLGFNFLYFIFSFLLPIRWVAEGSAYAVLFNIVVMLWISIGLWTKGVKSARFFVIAWFAYILSGIFEAFVSLGSTSSTHWLVQNITHIGLVLEIIFLSLAMVDKIQIYRLQTEEAQALALSEAEKNNHLIENQKEILAQKVEQTTQALQKSNQELQQYNTELQQTQAELTLQHDLLTQNHKELADYRHRIGKSIEAALLIQTSILPVPELFADYFADYFILYKPKDVISGDFYWLKRIEHQIILIQADCTGHGVPGALMTLIGYSILNQVIIQENYHRPIDILHELHRHIRKSLQQESTKNLEGMDISIVVLEREGQTWHMTFGGSGQKLVIIEQRELRVIRTSRRKVGGFSNKKTRQSFEQQQFSLSEGTQLYLNSDGFTDQNNHERTKFGIQKFQDLLFQHHQKPMSEQCAALESALQAHQQDEPQRDDIITIGIRL